VVSYLAAAHTLQPLEGLLFRAACAPHALGSALKAGPDLVAELLPGEHEIAVRQSGYKDFARKVLVEPRKRLVLRVTMERDPRVQFPTVTAEVKLQVTPDRAAVFLDDGFVGNVHEFGGVGRAMLVSPGKHRIKIALSGYQTFETEINLLPNQKFKIETGLVKGSITQADPLIKKE
jgi:hypothetical protein